MRMLVQPSIGKTASSSRAEADVAERPFGRLALREHNVGMGEHQDFKLALTLAAADQMAAFVVAPDLCGATE
jgi:hypothetical protein